MDPDDLIQGSAEPQNPAVTNLDQLEADAAAQDVKVAEDAKADATSKVTAEQQRQLEDQAARQGAAAAVGFLEALAMAKAPYLVVPDAMRENLINAAAPVIKKHGAGMPAFLVPWVEEIHLAVTLGMTMFAVYSQVQAHKAAEVAQIEEARARKAREMAYGPDAQQHQPPELAKAA